MSDKEKLEQQLWRIADTLRGAAFLSSMDNKIETVTSQITHTQTFKKGLLQQMFV